MQRTMQKQWFLFMLTILVGIVALLIPQLVIITDCLILGRVLKTIEWPVFNGTAIAPYALGEIQYRLHNFRITDLNFDNSELSMKKSTNAESFVNRLEVYVDGLQLKLAANWEYNGTDWFHGTDSGSITVEISENTLNFSVELTQAGKFHNGNITVSKCAVKLGNVTLKVEGKQDLFYETLAVYATDSLRDFLKESTCPKIKEEVERNGNAFLQSFERKALKLMIVGDRYLTLAHAIHWVVACILLFFLVLISFFGIGFLFLLGILLCLNLVVLSAMYVNRIKKKYRLLKAKAGFSSSAEHEFILPIARGFASKSIKVS